jgi:hypothetical protein
MGDSSQEDPSPALTCQDFRGDWENRQPPTKTLTTDRKFQRCPKAWITRLEFYAFHPSTEYETKILVETQRGYFKRGNKSLVK